MKECAKKIEQAPLRSFILDGVTFYVPKNFPKERMAEVMQTTQFSQIPITYLDAAFFTEQKIASTMGESTQTDVLNKKLTAALFGSSFIHPFENQYALAYAKSIGYAKLMEALHQF